MLEELSPRTAEKGALPEGRLSYKFQRLREQIRQAIVSGEFKGQLPGERELGRRFNANAKTINKALCDLSSEGLLVRIIGRGTFVADRTGSSSGDLRSLTYHLFSRSDQQSTPHRAMMLQALQDALQKRGHQLELISLNRPDELDSIPASAWAAQHRRHSAGLVCHPNEPQSESSGHPSDDLISEAWRRHIPVVLLAATSAGAKVNSVMPDFTHAGYCLAEHLFMLGCEGVALLRARAEGREADRVAVGCQTAAMRFERRMVALTIEGEADWVGGLLGDSSPTAVSSRGAQKRGPRTGIVCVGSKALAEARSDQTIADLVARGELVVTCVLEPGDAAGQEANMTSFEFDVTKIASWAARLLTESKPGRRPVEVLVPGELHLRGAAPTNGRHRASSDELSNSAGRSVRNERFVEAVI